MRRRRVTLAVILPALLALLLACSPAALEAYGDLIATARAIWDCAWARPEPDYDAISVLSTKDLLVTYGDPPAGYVDGIRATTQEIAAAWGIAEPYTATFTLGNPYPKPDGSGRTMVPYRFANPGGAYGVPDGGPVTGLCLEFETVDDGGTPVPLLADGYQVGDYVLPTTTPQAGYAECPSGITPTPTPSPGDAHEDDDPPNYSAIGVGESQGRSLEPDGDVDAVHLWVWSGLHLEVLTAGLGGNASTNVEIVTCTGTLYDADGGAGRIEWLSVCDEVAVVTVTSANGAYGPGKTYTLQVNQLP